MRNDNDQKTGLILSICGIVPVVWLSLLTAPYVSGGIVEIVSGLSVAVNNPFSITVCEDSVKTVLACIIFSLFAATPPAVNPDAAAVTMVWSYVGELVFNMLVLVGAVKMADRVVREMMGL